MAADAGPGETVSARWFSRGVAGIGIFSFPGSDAAATLLILRSRQPGRQRRRRNPLDRCVPGRQAGTR